MADQDNTIGTTGDYSTTQAWFDAVDGVTGNHIGRVQNQYVDGALTINTGAATATSYTLQPDTGAEHDGRSRNVSGSGAALRHTSRVVWVFALNTGTLNIHDLVLEQTADATTCIDHSTTTNPTVNVRRCVVEKRGTATTIGINSGSAGENKPWNITDNIVYGHTTNGIDGRGATGTIEHNTVVGDVGSAQFGILPGGACTCANNISVGHTTGGSPEDYWGSDPSDSSHGANIAEDTSAQNEWGSGKASINSTQVLDNSTSPTPTANYTCFENMTSGNEDFHIVDLQDGTYSSDPHGYAMTGKGSGTDIDGDTRDGSTPDVGADEAAAAPAAVAPTSTIYGPLVGPLGGPV